MSKPLRCAVYARYSTNKQNPLSIEDQVRKCSEYAKRRGWEFLEEWTYADEEISGATLERPGLREMLRGAESRDRPFDVILAEDTSRLSRKLADVLNLCERFRFAGTRVCFVSQGIDSSDEQFQLLIAARGMIDQLFLTDTAKRVRRGMEGRVLKGFSFGGRCFGYRRRKEVGGARLSVVEGEAAVVRRIFVLYAQGWSLKKIAKLLNAEGVSSPRPQRGRLQRSWAPGAIRHILLNQRYTGKLVWNRQEKVRNPATGRRVKRARPESEWVRVEAPELRVVSDELW